jgi:hypothetical protein
MRGPISFIIKVECICSKHLKAFGTRNTEAMRERIHVRTVLLVVVGGSRFDCIKDRLGAANTAELSQAHAGLCERE